MTNDRIKYDKMQILDHIFRYKFNPAEPRKEIDFFLSDIGEFGNQLNMELPASYSNFVLDLCRKNRGIGKRVPQSVIAAGYDLRKKTGTDPRTGEKFCGQFVWVGVGNEIQSWMNWPEPDKILEIDPRELDQVQRKMLRRDEAALVAVIFGLNLITKITDYTYDQVRLLQTPMKLQPNEIDGLFFSETDGKVIFFPVEAKASTTGDEINIDQLMGGYQTLEVQIQHLLPGQTAFIRQIAAVMAPNGIDFGIFDENACPGPDENFQFVRVIFKPKLGAW